MIDIAIIGGGPAGLSAAVNGVARGRKVTVFSRKKETCMIYKAESVNNHLGMPNISGKEMIDIFYNHAKELQIEIKEGRALQIIPMGSYFSINFENDIYNAKTIVLAVGMSKGSNIKGENDFLGKGVSYCATCDGMLYRDREVVIASEIEEGLEDANFLSRICSKVTLVSKKLATDELDNSIEIVRASLSEVVGDDVISAVKAGESFINCEGLFIIKEFVPAANLISGLKIGDKGSIEVNRLMETNIEGVFACGDCTGWPFQISNAIGEGLIAAQQADKYIK